MQKGPRDGYPPSEDTFLLADAMEGESGGAALDVGTGSGYLAGLLAGRFALVVCTDIDFRVLAGRTYPAPNPVCCSGADALRASFDLIVCNMPYLATDGILDPATDGGRDGLEVPCRILDSAVPRLAPGGRMLFTTSSLSDWEGLLRHARRLGLEARIVSRRRLFFEELMVAEGLAPE